MTRILTLLCIIPAFFLPFAFSQIPINGLTLAIKKPALAKDMLYICKTIFENAKFSDFKDIKEEEGEGVLRRGTYLTSFDVYQIDYNPGLLVDQLKYLKNPSAIKLESQKQNIVSYHISFKWRVDALGAAFLSGTGNATFTSSKLEILRTVSSGDLKVDFDLSAMDLKGFGQTDLLKEWIRKKLLSVTYNDLQTGIKHNIKFLKEYLFRPYFRLDRRIDKSNILTYESTEKNFTEVSNKIIVEFKTSLWINSSFQSTGNETTSLSESKGSSDYEIYSSPFLAALAFNSTASIGIYDSLFNWTEAKMLGQVKEFEEAIPELGMKYGPATPVRLFCAYPNNGGSFLLSGKHFMEFPVDCRFYVAPKGATSWELFLASTIIFRSKYEAGISADETKVFMGKLTQVTPLRTETVPQSADINVFMLRLSTVIGKTLYEGKSMQVPRIRYETLREYTGFAGKVDKDLYYVSMYNCTNDI